jgi:hypothetical protein
MTTHTITNFVAEVTVGKKVTSTDIETMLNSYLETAIWSSSGTDDQPLDRTFSPGDFESSHVDIARKDCARFAGLAVAIGLGGLTWEEIGHNFWLTRNHHGAGFWDRGLGEIGKELTKSAHTFGESYVYEGDDGQLYVA